MKKLLSLLAATFAVSFSANGLMIPNYSHQTTHKSQNELQPWKQANPSFPNNAIMELTPVYIDGTYFAATQHQGLWTSKDGYNWTQVPVQMIPAQSGILRSPIKINDTLYLATAIGLYYSNDQGVTWKRTNEIPPKVSIYCNPIKINNNIYVATAAGLYVKTPNSPIFKKSSFWKNTCFYSKPVQINNTIFLSGFGKSVGSVNGLYYSKDNGVTWHNAGITGLPGFLNMWRSVKYVNHVYFISTMGTGVYYSSNGLNWSKVTNKALFAANNTTNPHFKNGKYYIASKNGLYSSTDCIHWSTSQNYYAQNAVMANMITYINGVYYMPTENFGLCLSYDGINWFKDPLYIFQKPFNVKLGYAPHYVKADNTIYMGTVGAGLWYQKL